MTARSTSAAPASATRRLRSPVAGLNTSPQRPLDPSAKEGELAILFIRMFRSLDALVGSDVDSARKWLHAENSHLAGVPARLIQTVTGLVDVVEYLDAMRGKV